MKTMRQLIYLTIFSYLAITLLEVSSDNLGKRRLTNHPMEDVFPIWSPDGKNILFARGVGIAFTSRKYLEIHKFRSYIFIMNVEGSNLTRLSDLNGHDFQYTFSPDGQKVVFTRYREGYIKTSIFQLPFEEKRHFVNIMYSNVYIMDIDGKNLKNLTNNTKENSYAEEPSFSPDGSKIAFSKWDEGIWIISPDGSEEKQLVKNYARSPKWSPDGKKIAFRTDKGICIVEADGKNFIKLIDDELNAKDHTFSPDGNKIAFAGLYNHNGRTNYEIFVIDVNGSNLKKLTNMETFCSNPIWSPDGRKIVFESYAGGGKIYIMNSDGTGLKRVTDSKGREKSPSFSPNGEEITFSSLESGNWEIYVVNIKDF
ncbi:MAG: hypothetical protein NC833_03980 [Candidatus Omnitrophica bacterium]|nr:hypothetical protein [Candidatus Omnitrophota bacterium]MCM8804396.1 hypothetical protein [Candidatus Omnitrophota bacterium]